jgi:hypothetical protein
MIYLIEATSTDNVCVLEKVKRVGRKLNAGNLALKYYSVRRH